MMIGANALVDYKMTRDGLGGQQAKLIDTRRHLRYKLLQRYTTILAIEKIQKFKTS